MSWDLAEGTGQGDYPPFFTPADVADAERFEARVAQLAATVDPADPWSHPDAARLDALSFAGWLRAEGARPAVIRLHDLGALSMGGGSIERQSMLGQLRMTAAAGRRGGLRLRPLGGPAPARRQRRAPAARWPRSSASASAATARASSRCDVGAARAASTLAGGEELRAEAIVCALPVGPLRDVAVSGVSDARLASLHRQRQALAAKVVAAFPEPVWRAVGRQRPRRRRRASSARPGRRAATRSRCSSARSGSRTSSPRRRPSAGPRCSRRSSGSTARRRASPTRCWSATGASTRSPRATSPSGRPAT